MKMISIKFAFILFLLQSNLIAGNIKKVSFENEVKPILDKRCVVCHSCYNSPCQLKLSSFEGLMRGATKEAIYENRIEAANPSRLFIDATSQKEWSELGFYSVLKKSNETNIMMELLNQKQKNPQNIGNYAPEADELTCSKNLNELDAYLEKKPYHGMPYGFPALDKKEHELIIRWLQGDVVDDSIANTLVPKELRAFEKFLNNKELKYRVTARYIYEHLYLAHIKFENSDGFYSLVRAYNKDGSNVVKTRLPYTKAKKEFYYKFQKINSTIVHKTHMVYHFDMKKLQRYKALFINTKWKEKPHMLSYEAKIASNPLESFKQIPLKSRYLFLLDNVHYFIMTFIRGPVCKGQVALNVINDHFWVAFKEPEYDYTIQDKQFIEKNLENLSLPNEYGGSSDILDTFSIYKYNNLTTDYNEKKNALYEKNGNNLSLNSIWKGNEYTKKENDALLTIYRHFDSASVHKGALGDTPKTMWIIDYPLLERLYYSLVAGFDVYGNTQHKLLVRKYMDRLRIEGESNFLEYLPKKIRKPLFNSWYEGTLAKYMFSYTPSENQSTMSYHYNDLVANILKHLKIQKDSINFIEENSFQFKTIDKFKTKNDIEKALKNITYNNHIDKFKKFSSNNFNLIYIRFKMEHEDLLYTMVVNRWHNSVAFLFNEEERLNPQKDKINFINGFVGSYPNYFVVVEQNDIKEFFNLLSGKVDESKLSKFFINRNHKDFWKIYDWFQNKFDKNDPIESGLFDLNRYYKKSI
jgi:Fatty acid cis/trans isomerase (CTI)